MSLNSLYDSLKQRLESGEWLGGQRMPSIRKLAASADVSYHDVVSAYARLVSEGVLTASPGRGYFVTGGISHENPPNEPEWVAEDPLFKLLQAGPHYNKLGCGWLPPAWRDTELLAKAIRRTARLEQSSLAEYGDVSGYLPMRKQLCVHIKRLTRIDIRPGQVLTTLGATQGLDLVARLLIRPGDHVFVDEPGNGNLIRLIQLAGGHVVGVRRTQDGPDIAEMESYLAKHTVKAFFCNSTFHNPTGSNISPHNAFKVLRLAVEHEFYVVEDDVYGDFSPVVRQTFAELDNLERVIYVGSFSKCLSASLRVGYIACSQGLIEPLTRLKLLTCVAVPAFCERFVNTILADGTYARHMQNVQQRLIGQQVQTQRSLLERGWKFDMAPQGGMFIWAYHPDIPDLKPFMTKLEQHNILLMPGSAFSVTRDYQRFARINCTHFSDTVEEHFSV
ncbi:PLP-dependent aminotransferase family protein [Pseudomonas tremae]|nr:MULTISPECIES: PLP-dependent aminotransferase family protein [Pseudomonas syringae group]KGS16407.1 GntR family transcriptional regulator [Pseudomonas coronafaciens]KPY03795.1 GntR family transcriptional regulator/aminotransferase, s I [Pseudomonas coronafaciens pv. oryzae]MCQ3017543.1 PLP-dependent aminotransferase family protein [Pseudomonas tremae]MCQ3025253.1 PLP-dependent aminotransferase family protein [Pseudomonas tremae]QGL59534.1 aminotransferase class I/II-fold pyridoxal phosphate-